MVISLNPSVPAEYIVLVLGGPLAVNLAKAGHKVVLIEAGGDGEGDDLIQVPLFSPLVGEDPRVMDYFCSAVHGRVTPRE